jgi:hypothetical protein
MANGDAHGDALERARRLGAGAQPSPETCRDVVAALVEAYREAAQDAIHAAWGESWPAWAAQEAAALGALHARCAGWLARFEAAADRERSPNVPIAALRALLADLDGWPARPANFGDALDRLSDLLAASGGEAPDPAGHDDGEADR